MESTSDLPSQKETHLVKLSLLQPFELVQQSCL
jgi:hypothetical protein